MNSSTSGSRRLLLADITRHENLSQLKLELAEMDRCKCEDLLRKMLLAGKPDMVRKAFIGKKWRGYKIAISCLSSTLCELAQMRADVDSIDNDSSMNMIRSTYNSANAHIENDVVSSEEIHADTARTLQAVKHFNNIVSKPLTQDSHVTDEELMSELDEFLASDVPTPRAFPVGIAPKQTSQGPPVRVGATARPPLS